ncbi:nuclear body protein SP140-like isoform X3 [Panthera onca]|uniref:nuclear body protein SP140-like isoform X5 n=1 Tax=Panthera onca TaxID=9690 RepID=UPI0029542D47|nr:nuclear body protein SP140-like isoform X5 [Panthera onca]
MYFQSAWGPVKTDSNSAGLPLSPPPRGKPPRNVRCAVEEDHGSAVSLVREPFVKTRIPPAEAERNLWSCTFCRMESSGRQQCHGKSEVLEGLLQPEEQLICDYGEPFKEAVWLDLVKERLTEKVYTVPCFVRDARLIFHNHKMFYKVKGVSSFFCMSFPIFPNFRDSRTLQELYGPCPRERSKRVGLQKKTACKFQRW